MKIAIVGSPGSGKSTLAAGLFYHLKTIGEHVEHVPELIKYKVYKQVQFNTDGFDILNTMEQRDFEEIFDSESARSQIDLIICEAPLCNGYFYSSFYNKELEYPILKKIATEKINTYDVILFVERVPESEYISFGRKESLDEAKKLEDHISSKIQELNYSHKILKVNQLTPIKEILLSIGINADKVSKL